MEIAKIEVSRADARKIHCGTLTSGMVGVEVSFSFDEAWDGLSRIAVFKAGSTTKDVLLTNNRAEIPYEVLAKPCPQLVVGVYGINADGARVIPTVWAVLGVVNRGAKPSEDTSEKPTPEVWTQILGVIGDIGSLDTAAKENLVAAINEVLHRGADVEEIRQIIKDYLEENLEPVEDGEDGFSPIVTVTQNDNGAFISITDANGTTEAFIPIPQDGKDYILTDADRRDIAQKAAELVKVPSKAVDVGALPLPAGGKVGQYFRIAGIDEYGRVVAVEAVDAPEQSGGTVKTVNGIEADEDGNVQIDIPEQKPQVQIITWEAGD